MRKANMKKITCALVTFVLVLGLSATAFAAQNGTVKKASDGGWYDK